MENQAIETRNTLKIVLFVKQKVPGLLSCLIHVIHGFEESWSLSTMNNQVVSTSTSEMSFRQQPSSIGALEPSGCWGNAITGEWSLALTGAMTQSSQDFRSGHALFPTVIFYFGLGYDHEENHCIMHNHQQENKVKQISTDMNCYFYSFKYFRTIVMYTETRNYHESDNIQHKVLYS